MKLLKSLILILLLCSVSLPSDLGVKAQLSFNNHLGVGGGGGLLGLINITNGFCFYPSVDFWYSGEGGDRYWDGYDWVYYDDWYYIYEFAFNLDAAFLLPIKPVQPYLGFGMAPVITSEGWDYSYNEYSTVNAGFRANSG